MCLTHVCKTVVLGFVFKLNLPFFNWIHFWFIHLLLKLNITQTNRDCYILFNIEDFTIDFVLGAFTGRFPVLRWFTREASSLWPLQMTKHISGLTVWVWYFVHCESDPYWKVLLLQKLSFLKCSICIYVVSRALHSVHSTSSFTSLWCYFFHSSTITQFCHQIHVYSCLLNWLILDMNTSHLSPVLPASMVANGDDTKEPGHNQENAAAARYTHTVIKWVRTHHLSLYILFAFWINMLIQYLFSQYSIFCSVICRHIVSHWLEFALYTSVQIIYINVSG